MAPAELQACMTPRLPALFASSQLTCVASSQFSSLPLVPPSELLWVFRFRS